MDFTKFSDATWQRHAHPLSVLEPPALDAVGLCAVVESILQQGLAVWRRLPG